MDYEKEIGYWSEWCQRGSPGHRTSPWDAVFSRLGNPFGVLQQFVKTLAYESSLSLEDVCHLADQVYPLDDVAASVSSGTFRTEGMVIIPCSMKTLAGIACGYSDNLLLRAADVTLKERRKLVLVTRETPLSQIHLRNMLSLTQTGAVILPPMLTYYNNPQTIEDMTRHIVGKVMAEFGLEHPKFHRWK